MDTSASMYLLHTKLAAVSLGKGIFSTIAVAGVMGQEY
jgi:hypothetical protein